MRTADSYDRFASDEPVCVLVGSTLPYWELSCVVGGAVGPDGSVIEPEDIFLVPTKQSLPKASLLSESRSLIKRPGKFSTGVGQPIVVAEGGTY